MTGEWTVERVRDFVYRDTGADLRDDTAKSVADAHNAALAAAVDEFTRYHHNPIVADLNKQLAAEQARCYNDGWVAGREPLQEQLAAGHKQYEELAVSSTDKIKTLVDALKRLAEFRRMKMTPVEDIASDALAKVGEKK